MYKLEIFDHQMEFVSACYTDDAQTISLDYLAYDPFQVQTQDVTAKKGYFCHITDAEGNLIADCIISDVQPEKTLQTISLRPLPALFDADVFYSAVSDAITWIGQTLTEQYVTASDTLQRRPLVITTTPGSRNFPLTGYNLNPTMNILSVICNAFSTWDVVTDCRLDLEHKKILVNIYEQTAAQTIECDLENIIDAQVTLGDSYGSTNKLTIKKTVQSGTPSGTTSVTYYRHNNGNIDTSNTDRIVPVFFGVDVLAADNKTDADWLAEAATMAKEKLNPAAYDNEVILQVWEDDKIINPRQMAIGTAVTLHLRGSAYYSILTGVSVEGSIYTLTFGAIRTELTKKLTIQKRQ